MTFLELAERVLKEANRPLTADEIWTLAVEKGYDGLLKTKGKTPWATLSAQLYVSVKDNPYSPFLSIDERPKRFFLRADAQKNTGQTDENTSTQIQLKNQKKVKFLEKDLHPFLSYFAYFHLRCYTKTINHSLSPKNEFGEWVHPDMVGCYFPLDDWKHEVIDLSVAIGNISIKITSFEIKRELNFNNLRESFFQTVSNSTWANESYLVAAEISENEEFRKELSRLSASFGVGVIRLNLFDPHSSEIIFPAKTRDYLDWDTINKLAMNPDFKEFITTVKIDITSKKIHKKEYDPVLEYDILIQKAEEFRTTQ